MGKTFWEDVERGALGESVVWNYLSSLDNIRSIIDVRKDKRYFNKEDVDFLVQTWKNDIYKIEIKTDFKAHETNNLFYEIKTLTDKGCFDRTKSDIIFYYIPQLNQILKVGVDRIRKYITNNSNNLKVINGGDYGTTGYLINIDMLEKSNVLKKIQL